MHDDYFVLLFLFQENNQKHTCVSGEGSAGVFACVCVAADGPPPELPGIRPAVAATGAAAVRTQTHAAPPPDRLRGGRITDI